MTADPKKTLDRRSFLGYGAAAGVMMSGLAPARAAVRQADDLNVALIGAGAQGKVLVDSCLKIPGVRFKAVCDIWAEFSLLRTTRMLGKYGHEVTGYEDFREMLSAEMEAHGLSLETGMSTDQKQP